MSIVNGLPHKGFARIHSQFVFVSSPFSLFLTTVSRGSFRLVPRPFPVGEETAWEPLLTHARHSHKNRGVRIRLYTFRLTLT